LVPVKKFFRRLNEFVNLVNSLHVTV
jgi:hypothetical protein